MGCDTVSFGTTMNPNFMGQKQERIAALTKKEYRQKLSDKKDVISQRIQQELNLDANCASMVLNEYLEYLDEFYNDLCKLPPEAAKCILDTIKSRAGNSLEEEQLSERWDQIFDLEDKLNYCEHNSENFSNPEKGIQTIRTKYSDLAAGLSDRVLRKFIDYASIRRAVKGEKERERIAKIINEEVPLMVSDADETSFHAPKILYTLSAGINGNRAATMRTKSINQGYLTASQDMENTETQKAKTYEQVRYMARGKFAEYQASLQYEINNNHHPYIDLLLTNITRENASYLDTILTAERQAVARAKRMEELYNEYGINADYERIQNMSDKEFAQYQGRLKEKIQALPDSIENIGSFKEGVEITRENALVIDTMLSDERFQNSQNFGSVAMDIVNYIESDEEAKTKVLMLNAISSIHDLPDDMDYMSCIMDFINYSKTQKLAEIPFTILENKELRDNRDFIRNITNSVLPKCEKVEPVVLFLNILPSIDGFLDNKENAGMLNTICKNIANQGKAMVILRMLADEKIRNGKYMKHMKDFLLGDRYGLDEGKAKISALNALSSIRYMCKDSIYTYNIAGMIQKTRNLPQARVTNAILSNETLRDSKTFIAYVGHIIDSLAGIGVSDEKADTIIDLLNRASSDKNLFIQEESKIALSDFLSHLHYTKVMTALTILANEKLRNSTLFTDPTSVLGEEIFYGFGKDDEAKASVLNTISSIQDIPNDEISMDDLASIVRCVANPAHAKVANFILINENLRKSKVFMQKVPDIIRRLIGFDTSSKDMEAVIAILEAVSAHNNICNNETIMQKVCNELSFKTTLANPNKFIQEILLHKTFN